MRLKGGEVCVEAIVTTDLYLANRSVVNTARLPRSATSDAPRRWMSVASHCLQPTVSGWDICMPSIESAELNGIPLMLLLQARKPPWKIRITTASITTHTLTHRAPYSYFLIRCSSIWIWSHLKLFSTCRPHSYFFIFCIYFKFLNKYIL